MRCDVWRGLTLLALGVAAGSSCGGGGEPSESPPLACPVPEQGSSDPCCTPCDSTEQEECNPVMSFPNEAQTRREWKDIGGVRMVAGVCADGTHLLSMSNGFFSDTRYFDSSGQFIGLRRSSDFDPVCTQPYRYFPAHVRCQVPRVTEVILDEPDPL